ncbi:MAG: hypothetical protein AB1716_00670 [Planctomycetota bacterium]
MSDPAARLSEFRRRLAEVTAQAEVARAGASRSVTRQLDALRAQGELLRRDLNALAYSGRRALMRSSLDAVIERALDDLELAHARLLGPLASYPTPEPTATPAAGNRRTRTLRRATPAPKGP